MAKKEVEADVSQHPSAVEAQAIVDRLTKAVGAMDGLASQAEKWLDGIKDDTSYKSSDMAAALFLTKELYDQIDKQVKRIYHVKDALSKHFLPKRLEDEGLDMVRIPSLGRSFSIRDMLSASFIEKQAGFDWLRSIGQGDIVQETVNAGTLSSFIRNMILEEGMEPPAEIVKVSTYKDTSITKYTPKKKVA